MAINADITLKRLVAELSTWAAAHEMLNKFGYGDFLELYSESDNTYPYLMANSSNATEDQWYFKFTLEIGCFDWVFDDKINDLSVESQTAEILRDLTNTIRTSPRWQSFSRLAAGDNSLRKYKERGGDKVYGWAMTLNLWIKKRSGFCYLENLMPEYDFESQSVPCSATVTANDTLMVELECCDEYVFSIKNSLGVLVGTWNAGTKTWTVPSGSGGSIATEFNDTPVTDSEDPLSINVVDPTDTPKGTIIVDTANEKKIEIAYGVLSINGFDFKPTEVEAATTLAVENTENDAVGFDDYGVWRIADSNISNSNDTFSDVVKAEGDYELADTTVDVYLDGVLNQSVSIVTLDPAAEINISL